MSAAQTNSVVDGSQPVEQVAVQAGLILQLHAAHEACDRIREMIHEGQVVGDWCAGRAEGAALAEVSAVTHALMCLRSSLQVRLGWPDVEAQPESGGPSVLDAARNVAESAACSFCHGQPVGDADEWLDGEARPPAPCPRCGETHVLTDDDGPF